MTRGPDSTRDEAVFSTNVGKHQAWLIIEVKLFFVRKVSTGFTPQNLKQRHGQLFEG
jgi:hypothetical protein